MTSIIDQQIITIHILANISICKISQAIKLGQLWDITWEIFSFKNHGENKAESLVPDLFLFFKKTLYKVKASGHHFSFNIFWYTSTWTYNKSKLITFHWAITVGNMYIEFICWPVCDVINFESNLSFLIKLFFYKTNKSGQKSHKQKELRTWNKKNFPSFLNCFHWSK